jgi:hypothetical protein
MCPFSSPKVTNMADADATILDMYLVFATSGTSSEEAQPHFELATTATVETRKGKMRHKQISAEKIEKYHSVAETWCGDSSSDDEEWSFSLAPLNDEEALPRQQGKEEPAKKKMPSQRRGHLTRSDSSESLDSL